MRTLLAILFLTTTVCFAEEQSIQVKLKNVQYGVMKVRSEGVIGSHLTKQLDCLNIREKTDRIEISPEKGLGFRARVEASQGKYLAILFRWVLPGANEPGAPSRLRQSRFGYIKNNSDLVSCYLLEQPWEMIPGEWTIEAFLVGIDEPPEVVIEDIENRTPMLLYRRVFHLYEQE